MKVLDLDDSETSLLSDRLQALVADGRPPPASYNNISKRGILKTPKLVPTLGVIYEDDYFDDITDIMGNDEEASPF